MVDRARAIARLDKLLRYYFGGHTNDMYPHVANVIAHDRELQTALGAAHILPTPEQAPQNRSDASK